MISFKLRSFLKHTCHSPRSSKKKPIIISIPKQKLKVVCDLKSAVFKLRQRYNSCSEQRKKINTGGQVILTSIHKSQDLTGFDTYRVQTFISFKDQRPFLTTFQNWKTTFTRLLTFETFQDFLGQIRTSVRNMTWQLPLYASFAVIFKRKVQIKKK